MDEAQANLDALSDEELEGGAFLADPSGGGEWIDDPEPVSRCGYCGEASDYCQGHGEDERAAFGFDYDSDEYEARREFFEENDTSSPENLTPDMTDMQGRAFRPNYDEPDPFDRSDPEQARQAKAIEDMNETLGE